MSDKDVSKQLLAIASQLTKIASVVAKHGKGDASFPLEALEKVAQSICLICNEAIVAPERADRGAHHRCYKQMREQIKSGELTDEKAVSLGLLTPPDKGGRKPSAAKGIGDIIQEAEARAEETSKAPKKPTTKRKPEKP
jgi:hypothetical protein